MKLYIQAASDHWHATLVRAAQIIDDRGDYGVHHPEAGYSVWPADTFEAQHRPLSRHEAQLVNHTVAELEVMAISDAGAFNVLSGELTLVDGRKI